MSNRTVRLSVFFMLVILSAFLTMAVIPPPPPPPPPPEPPATCTPGFWKQPHHFQYWVGYSPSDPYMDTGMTLLEALQGGNATRTSRFVVAGWLNAANPDAPCY